MWQKHVCSVSIDMFFHHMSSKCLLYTRVDLIEMVTPPLVTYYRRVLRRQVCELILQTRICACIYR